ncbi:MAG: universal stress protein [Bacteroidota bacterium]
MMSCILIPVDFSVPSHNAYRFGLRLAEDLNMGVVLVHYYEGSFNPNEPLIISGGGSIHDSYLNRLWDFARASGEEGLPPVELPADLEITYETGVTLSPSADIIKRALEPDIDLVVMATRSSKRLLDRWLGSTSITVSEACPRPVFLVPPAVKFTPFKRIVVANNHATADPLPLWELETLADFHDAKVHFVHVENEDRPLVNRFVPWALMEELTGDGNEVDYPFEVVNVEEDDITEGLLDYAEDVQANLVVIVNRLRKRWQALLRASLTQDLALHSEEVPILVLHTRYSGIADRLANRAPAAEH